MISQTSFSFLFFTVSAVNRCAGKLPYRPLCNITTFQRSDEEEELYICERSQEGLNYSWQPYLQNQPDQD